MTCRILRGILTKYGKMAHSWNKKQGIFVPLNRSFPSFLFLLFQIESWCTHFHIEMKFSCTFIVLKSNSFSYEMLCTETRFETEGKGNSKIAYCLDYKISAGSTFQTACSRSSVRCGATRKTGLAAKNGSWTNWRGVWGDNPFLFFLFGVLRALFHWCKGFGVITLKYFFFSGFRLALLPTELTKQWNRLSPKYV